jgi:hypothetical protein
MTGSRETLSRPSPVTKSKAPSHSRFGVGRAAACRIAREKAAWPYAAGENAPHLTNDSHSDRTSDQRCDASKSCTLKGGGIAHPLVQAERRGLSFFIACMCNHGSRFRVRAWPFSPNAAPLGAGRPACGAERVISHAHNIGALRALPQRWVTRRRSGFVQGGDFLPKKSGTAERLGVDRDS